MADEEKEFYPVQDELKLDPVDMQIVRLKVEYPRIEVREIAKKIGYSVTQTSRRFNSERVRRALAELAREPLEILKGELRTAANVIAKSLRSSDENLRYRVARDLLLSEGILKHYVGPEGGDSRESTIIVVQMPESGQQMIMGPKDVIEAEAADATEIEIEV